MTLNSTTAPAPHAEHYLELKHLENKHLSSAGTSRAVLSHLVSPPCKDRLCCCYYCYCCCCWGIFSPALLHPRDWTPSCPLPPPQRQRSSTPPLWPQRNYPRCLRPSVKSLVLLTLLFVGCAGSQQLCPSHRPAGRCVCENRVHWSTWVGVYTCVCVCARECELLGVNN